MKKNQILFLFLQYFLFASSDLVNQAPGKGNYDIPFYPIIEYDDKISTPESILGFQLGSRAIKHSEILIYFKYLDSSLSNVKLFNYGRSYEGRELIYLVISSISNMVRLDRI